MPERSRFVHVRELLLTAGPALLLVLGGFWLASLFVSPAPPNRLSIAAAGKRSPYWEAAQRYREYLASNGVDLAVVETSGSLENLALMRDPNSGVAAAFVQGGISSSSDLPHVYSLGRMFYEPVWIFYQGPDKLERLTELVGKRVLIGPAASATATLATRLLAASGVTAGNTTFLNMELPAYVAALSEGRADAGLLVLGPQAQTIQRLLANPKVRLMSVAQADAYVQRFAFLSKIEMKEGVVDFARNVPPTDTLMLTTTAAIVVRESLHPALANLLTQAAIVVHAQPRLDGNGETALFERAGAFPRPDDQEFPLSPDALRVYKSGPPLLQRVLPFWLATLVDRLFVLILPAIGILLPVLRFAPVVYTWRVRARTMYWYRVLKRAEDDLGPSPGAELIRERIDEIDRIEEAVNRLPVPLGFTNQLYDLREHIDVVRRRLLALKPAGA